MPPRRPPTHRPVASIKVAADPLLLAKTRAIRQPKAYNDPDLSTQAKRAIRHVDEAIESLDGYQLNGVTCHTVQDTIRSDSAPWDCDFMNEVLRYILERPATTKSGKLAQDTFRNYALQVLAVNRKIAHHPVTRSERKRIYLLIEDLVKEYALAIYGYDRAQIGFGTINAMLAAVPSAGVGWQRAISHILFQSLASYTGLRPAHLARSRSITVLDSPAYDYVRLGGDGTRLRDFHLWYERPNMNAAPRIYGWFLPRGGKTRHSRGNSFWLAPTGVLGFSPALLVLVYAGHRGAFGDGGIAPLFTGLKGDIHWPSEALDIPLFESQLNANHNVGSPSITQTIHLLCGMQGIDGLVDSRCFRSMTAAYTYAKHGAETTMLWLGHQDPNVTRRYTGKADPVDLQKVIFRDKGSTLSAIDVNRRNAKPRLGAPRTVSTEALELLLQDSKLQSLISQQEDAKRQLALQKSNQDPLLVKQRANLTAQWYQHFNGLLKNKLADEKAQYMKDLATGVIPVGDTAALDIITLERMLYDQVDTASRPEHALVDASSIVMPSDEQEIALIKTLFDSPDAIMKAYDLLAPDGVLSKRKTRANGPMAMRRLAEASKLDKQVIEDDDSEIDE